MLSEEWRLLLVNRCKFAGEAYISHYADVLAAMDERLIPNVLQWLNYETVDDVWIGKYCINAILSIRGDHDFLSAAEAMDLYLKDEEAGVISIWRPKR